MEDIYEEIAKIRREGGSAALATVVRTKGSTPRSEGAKMLIKSDGTIIGSIGGGCPEAEVWQEAKKVMEEGRPRIVQFDLTGREADSAMICGGIVDIFIEPVVSQPTIYFFGAGHIGFSAAKIAKTAGFRVVVVDDRHDYASREKFPEADELYAQEYQEIFPHLFIDDNSYIVIACRDHTLDQTVLEMTLKTPARYIGMIASKKKAKTTLDNLADKGVSREALQRVHSPIGLDISAETPEEIAVSIVAELIKVRREKPQRP